MAMFQRFVEPGRLALITYGPCEGKFEQLREPRQARLSDGGFWKGWRGERVYHLGTGLLYLTTTIKLSSGFFLKVVKPARWWIRKGFWVDVSPHRPHIAHSAPYAILTPTLFRPGLQGVGCRGVVGCRGGVSEGPLLLPPSPPLPSRHKRSVE